MSDVDDEVAAIARRLEYARLELDPLALLDAWKMMGALEARHDLRMATLEAKVARAKRSFRITLRVCIGCAVFFVALNGYWFFVNLRVGNYLTAFGLSLPSIGAQVFGIVTWLRWLRDIRKTPEE